MTGIRRKCCWPITSRRLKLPTFLREYDKLTPANAPP